MSSPAASNARTVDLNADLGESFGRWVLGDDTAMLEVVSSANVACGFHAGDPTGLLLICEQAAERGVVIGAHVSYRDLVGFGRRFVDATAAELTADVLYQIGALDGLARAAGTAVRYVKPHGALYNSIVEHPEHAAAVVEAVRRYDPELPVVGLPGSQFLQLAQRAGLRTIREAFADRAYTPQGTLLSRREPGAVLHDADTVAARMVGLVTTGRITAVDGTEIELTADSLCTHGDSPGAVAIARAVRAAIEATGVTIRPFVAA
ncbi:LamB/YcsF family protein [Nakamurella lactea]|uniref:LamB/YcsF family protein n=1 Tax=Nakamurella lactea TaxID=459515 RepID=UPI0003FD7387|nr:5-oxoprolinase subunit PxpA [Nakamurella lactea]